MGARRILLYSMVLAAGLALACTWPGAARTEEEVAAAPKPVAEIGFQRGFVLGLFRKDSAYFIDREYERELAELCDLGCNSVTVIVRCFMEKSTSTTIEKRPPDTVVDRRLRTVIRAARARGLSVTLFPYVLLARPEGNEWRGNIKPSSWPDWFDSYRAMITDYATLSAAEGVDNLCIGSELVSSERFKESWEEIIAATRAVYSGRIFYSANWDHYRDLDFLAGTDFAAINAYNRLVDVPTTDAGVLAASWRRLQADLLAWADRVGKPLLFTEVGYASVVGSSVDPWDYTRRGEVALAEQAACHEAFARVWRDEEKLAGVHYYVWWGRGGSSDTGYTPRGKPAEAIIREFFRHRGAAETR